MTWFVLVSCYILKGMFMAADSYEEFKKDLDRLIDDALIVRYESGQGLILVNLYGRYVYCQVTINDMQDLVIQHSEEDDTFLNVAKFKDGWKEEVYAPEWNDLNDNDEYEEVTMEWNDFYEKISH